MMLLVALLLPLATPFLLAAEAAVSVVKIQYRRALASLLMDTP
jgi:hypothetical protein